jgi:hypothetical protein
MSEYDRQKQGRVYEGYAFTFCKAALLALIFQRYTLLAVSGLSTLFYILASLKGIKEFHCWAKPPWVTIFWGMIFIEQCVTMFYPHPARYWL